jgi:arsenite methyltransferase
MSKQNEHEQIREAVKNHYAGRVAGSCCSTGCCGDSGFQLENIGATNYTPAETEGIPGEALQYSFGCGNPLAFAGVSEGETVVDIGSGAGLDAILAARAVGDSGHVFGLDMTEEMIERAWENVNQAGLSNITFLLGVAEDIPLADETADWVISNCVINLSPDKEQVFSEIYRILKPGGRVLISDIVADNLPREITDSISAWSGCIAGAISQDEYLQIIDKAGFSDVSVLDSVEHSLNVSAEEVSGLLPEVSETILAAARQNGTRIASIRIFAKK